MEVNLNYFKQKRGTFTRIQVWAFWGPGVESRETGGNPPLISVPLSSFSVIP